MKRREDLIDQFADLVLGADDPRHLAERTLEVIMSLSNGRSGAVFAKQGERLTLFASKGIDQDALDAVTTLWGRYQELFNKGETLYIENRASDRRLPKEMRAQGQASSFAIVPVSEGDDLVALLYVDSRDPNFCAEHDLERLGKFARIVSKAVTGSSEAATTGAWETYLERTPMQDMERQKMLLLLNRNEWNIARVSRLMGVTRRTIYLKLQRYRIPRERIRKTRRRTVPA